MRPTKSPALKLLQGTARGDRIRDLPRFTAAIPRPPDSLSPKGRRFWRELAGVLSERRVMTNGDRQILALCCTALAQHEEAQAVLAAEGPTYTTTTEAGSTLHRTRPEVAIASDAWRRAAQALGALGLTPRGRNSVEMAR